MRRESFKKLSLRKIIRPLSIALLLAVLLLSVHPTFSAALNAKSAQRSSPYVSDPASFSKLELPFSPFIFVFAHQDDEIAYFAMMKKLVERGHHIKILWITDGGASAPPDIRRKESRDALSLIGIKEDSLIFWDYPDGKSIFYPVEIVDRLTVLMRRIKPRALFVPAYEGGHPDHDFAHFAAVTAAMRMKHPPDIFEAPLYNRYNTSIVAFNQFIPAETPTLYTYMTRCEVFLKFRAFLTYRSQFWGTVLPALIFGGPRLFDPKEPYRKKPSWNYLNPPHEGELYYESFPLKCTLGITFKDFAEAVRKVLSARQQ